MAFAMEFKDGKRAYSVSFGVGRDRFGRVEPNRFEDVMLVQFLLRRGWEPSSDSRPQGQLLQVDGIFGPTTHYWILAFQALLHKRITGTVKSLKPADSYDALEVSEPNMFWLCNGYNRLANGNRLAKGVPGFYTNLLDDPKLPAQLRLALKTQPHKF